MRRIAIRGSPRRILVLVLFAALTATCQAQAAGWIYAIQKPQSRTEVAAAYALAADLFAANVDAAHRAFATPGQNPTGQRLAAFYGAFAAELWRLATTVGSIHSDAEVDAALGAVIDLATGESAALRVAARSDDPVGALGAVIPEALARQRAIVDRLRGLLGLPLSRTDDNYFY